MKALTQFAGLFEKMLARMPAAIRKPVEREWRPLQELFLRRRAPKLLVISLPGLAADRWIREVFQMDQGKTEAASPPWFSYRHRGTLDYAVVESEKAAREALLRAEPDLFLYLSTHETPVWAELRGGRPMVHADFGEPRGVVLAALSQALPLEARLEFARVSGEPSAQIEIAAMLTRSTTAICAAIGAQPIPLADFPILTSLQVSMVAGIVFTTGREWSVKLARDFLGALGVNIGTGFLLREGARAAVKLLPGWGNAISGAIAGAGTYAIGRAASAYFIEGLSLAEARHRFKLLKRSKPKE
ncbi:MAG: hypothetical protein NTZ46_02260 [Verrucomicrobia bacterium]|nr:hypothetical protein [Verrucomicrobiota bacterium]